MRFRALVPTTLFSLVATFSPCIMAQSGSVEVKTNVPFEFIVGKKLFPAGSYIVVRNSNDSQSLQLTQEDRKHLTMLTTLTRLARQPSVSSIKASLVFDVLNNQYFLSEVWIPEVDGYQVSTTTQIHKHAFVEVKE